VGEEVLDPIVAAVSDLKHRPRVRAGERDQAVDSARSIGDTWEAFMLSAGVPLKISKGLVFRRVCAHDTFTYNDVHPVPYLSTGCLYFLASKTMK
jgi:hypothetical protein